MRKRRTRSDHPQLRIRQRVDPKRKSAPRLSDPLLPPVEADPMRSEWVPFLERCRAADARPSGFGSPQADAMARLWLGEPVAFAHHMLGHRTWPGQCAILNAVKTFPRVAVKGCHASSKTFTAAELTLWWLSRFPSDAVVLTTAATGRQVQSVLWQEIRSTLESPRLLLNFPKCDRAKLKIAEGHYAIGFATSPTGAFCSR